MKMITLGREDVLKGDDHVRAKLRGTESKQSGLHQGTMRFHTDAGHGWLRIDREAFTARANGIKRDISSYSYMDAEAVYLEEDCDMGRWLNHLGFRSSLSVVITSSRIKHDKQESVILGGVLYIPHVHDGDQSPIRAKAQYEPSAF